MTIHKRVLADSSIALYSDSTKDLFVEGERVGYFSSIEEVDQFCESIDMSNAIAQEIKVTSKHLTDMQIALIIQENAEVRTLPSIVDGFRLFAETKQFIPSKSLVAIRESMNNLPIPGKIDYVMRDGSKVAIDFETNRRLNNSINIEESADQIRNMTESASTFVNAIKQFLKD